MLDIGVFIPKPRETGATLEELPQKARDIFYEGALADAKTRGVDAEPYGVFRALSDFTAQMIGYYAGGLETSQVSHVLYKHQYLPPKRGLLICGSVGTGKTVLTRYFIAILNHFLPMQERFQFIRCGYLMDEIYDQSEGYVRYYKDRYRKRHCIFDDLGPEGNAQVYGMPFGMKEILTRRYDEWCEFGTMSIITTNLNGSGEVVKRYGERVEDRFCEMFDIHIMANKSRRKRNSAKVLER